MGKIFISGLRMHAYHGVFSTERSHGQRFVMDITLDVSLEKAGRSDRLGDTVDYGAVAKSAEHEFTRTSHRLLERAAYAVAVRILKDFKKVSAVTVRLQKPDAPIDASFDSVGIEISLQR